MNVDLNGHAITPLWLSIPNSKFTLRAVPLCPSGVLKAIKLTKWYKSYDFRFFSNVFISNIYQVYTFTITSSQYSYFMYNIWTRVDSYKGWMNYLVKKYGWISKLKSEIEYGLGLLDSIPTIPIYISGPAAVVSFISSNLPAYIPNEARYVLRMLTNYRETESSIFIAYSLDVISMRAKRKYWLWGPIVGWEKTYLFKSLLPY